MCNTQTDSLATLCATHCATNFHNASICVHLCQLQEQQQGERKGESERERQLLGHVYNCQLNARLASIVSLCVCVRACGHVSCIICHAAAAARQPFDRLLCAPVSSSNLIFRMSVRVCVCVSLPGRPACLCARGWSQNCCLLCCAALLSLLLSLSFPLSVSLLSLAV